MMANPLLVWPLCIVFFVITWWIRRCPQIVVEKKSRSHISCMHNPCTPRVIIILMVFSSLSLSFKPWTFWFRKKHYWGQVSKGIVYTQYCNSLLWPVVWVPPSWFLSLQVRGIFAKLQWLVDEPWRRLGVPVSSTGKVKGRDALLSEGCSGVWLCRPWNLSCCHVSEVILLRPITRRYGGVGDEEYWRDHIQVFK